jgi:hypothetical protein
MSSNYAVGLYITAKAAAVTACGASDMKVKVPEYSKWLTTFGLVVIYNDFPPVTLRPFAINFIRRIYSAFLEYDLAREQVLKHTKDDNGRWSPYFAALNHFEIAVSQLYIAIDSFRKLSKKDLFTTGDGSIEEGLNRIYNASKHQLAGTELPVWFTNDGLECAEAVLTFTEIEGFMLTMADVVKGLCNSEATLQTL